MTLEEADKIATPHKQWMEKGSQSEVILVHSSPTTFGWWLIYQPRKGVDTSHPNYHPTYVYTGSKEY